MSTAPNASGTFGWPNTLYYSPATVIDVVAALNAGLITQEEAETKARLILSIPKEDKK